MAINFSASFAACIAAGLKVPRQIMYCITQDTGQPYVLYKDSQEAERNAAAIGSTAASQWGTEMYPGIQQAQTHLSAQQQNAAIAANGPNGQSNGQQQQQSTSSPNTDPNVRENGDAGGGTAGGGAGSGGTAAGAGARQQGSPSTSPYPTQQRANGSNEDDVNMHQV